MPTRLPTLTRRSSRPSDSNPPAPASPPSAIVHKPLSAISRFGSTFFNRKTIVDAKAETAMTATRPKRNSTSDAARGPPRRGATETDLLASMPAGDLTKLVTQSSSVRNLLKQAEPTATAGSLSAATKNGEPNAKEDGERPAAAPTDTASLVPHRPVEGSPSSSSSMTTQVSTLVPRRPILSKRMSANDSILSSVVTGSIPTRSAGSFRNLLHFDRSKVELPGVTEGQKLSQVSNSSIRETSGDGSDSGPQDPQHVLTHYGDELTSLEKKEIVAFPEVFYFSTLGVKRRRRNGRILTPNELGEGSDLHSDREAAPTNKVTELHNDGYDDDRGDYLMLMQDHLGYRYEVLHPLGSGSFGQVVCCLDHKTKAKVAVKVIRNRKKYKEQALIEIQVLALLQEVPTAKGSDTKPRRASDARSSTSNVVQMIDHFVFRNHLCITFELLGMNLYEYLKLRFFQGMPMANIRVVARQLSMGLAHLRAKSIIHCDLKPENVLIKAPLQCFGAGPGGSSVAFANVPVENICLIDFGSSCLNNATIYTYIQSRFYRSPEVILGHPYSTPIDMWSLGCILVELHTGHPIFAGENETEQLMCMMEILGVPPVHYLARCKRRKCFFHEVQVEESSSQPVGDNETPSLVKAVGPTYKPMAFTNSRGRKRVPGLRDLGYVVKSDDAEFIALLRKCFTWDPEERLTPESALAEPWMQTREHERTIE